MAARTMQPFAFSICFLFVNFGRTFFFLHGANAAVHQLGLFSSRSDGGQGWTAERSLEPKEGVKILSNLR